MKNLLYILLFYGFTSSKTGQDFAQIQVCTNAESVAGKMDSSIQTIHLAPLAGDNYRQLQDAINYQINTPGTEIVLSPGVYNYSQPLIFATKSRSGYQNVIPRLRGAVPARNAAMGVSELHPTFHDGPAIAIQQGKGGYIEDLYIHGNYTFPTKLTPLQIDTLSNWDDGTCRFNPSSPYAGIVIDPFSDPSLFRGKYQMYPSLTSYYLSGMGNSGTTGTYFSGLYIDCFVVGFIITPSEQQNGEIISLEHSQIQYCYTAYAIDQTQSKDCRVIDFEDWGGTHTVFDNVSWGIKRGDGGGSPMIDGTNIAGYNYEIFNIINGAFHGSFNNVFAEEVFQIGKIGANAGASLTNSEISLQQESPNVPSPEAHLKAGNTIFLNDVIRQYGSTNSRIIMSGWNDIFIGGQQNGPPLYGGAIYDPNGIKPVFQGLAFYNINGSLWRNDYDTIVWSGNVKLHVNRKNFTGWFLGGNKSMTGGDAIICINLKEDAGNYPVGYISKITNDTIFLQNTGTHFHDTTLTVYDCQFKKNSIRNGVSARP